MHHVVGNALFSTLMLTYICMHIKIMEILLYAKSTLQSKIACKFAKDQKSKNITPSVDGEYPLKPFNKILYRAVIRINRALAVLFSFGYAY